MTPDPGAERTLGSAGSIDETGSYDLVVGNESTVSVTAVEADAQDDETAFGDGDDSESDGETSSDGGDSSESDDGTVASELSDGDSGG